eukprot:SAG25_NODE_1519_length_2854_cov_51.421416_1_plen_149_part_00
MRWSVHGSAGVLLNEQLTGAHPRPLCRPPGRSNGFVMKGGDATKGKLKTMWDGPRPDARTGPKGQQCSYQPMRKQGAIILGTLNPLWYPDRQSDLTENYFVVRAQSGYLCPGAGTGGDNSNRAGASSFTVPLHVHTFSNLILVAVGIR